MLAYLESLCSALKARDERLISELLRHPLASALPASVREEAQGIATRHDTGHVAPIHTLRLYHQTAHLLGACTDPASRRPAKAGPVAPPAVRARQMELELAVRAAVA